MQKINNIAELKLAIQGLEVEQAAKWSVMKDQFLTTYESLKPLNLLKSSFKEIFSSPSLLENIFGNGIGIAGGYLSKKIVVGSSSNNFRKILGSILQFGVTNAVANNPDVIKRFGRLIMQYIFHKKEENIENKDC